ncbi:MAG: hypothetical protein AAF218_09205 [Pseudomonadota bacterium]
MCGFGHGGCRIVPSRLLSQPLVMVLYEGIGTYSGTLLAVFISGRSLSAFALQNVRALLLDGQAKLQV